MSGSALRDSLSAMAAKECARIQGETDAKVSAILAAAEAEASSSRQKALSLLQREIADDEARIRGEQAQAKRSRLLLEKLNLLDEVHTRAKARIDSFSSDTRYPETLSKLVLEAAELLLEASKNQVGTEETGIAGEIRVRQEDAAIIASMLSRKNLEGRVRLIPESGLPSGSVLANSLDGRFSVDNSLQSRLARSRKRCASVAAAVLFPGEPA